MAQSTLIVIVFGTVVSAVRAEVESCSASTTCDVEMLEESSALGESRYKEDLNEFAGFWESLANATAHHEPCGSQDCACFHGTLEADLMPFADGISRDMIEQASSYGVRYVVINGSIFREKSCTFPARCEGVEHFLKEVLDDLDLPVEFVVNDYDWPKVPNRGSFPPVFSFSKTESYGDIMYPAWSFWCGGPAISLYPTGIGRWDRVRGSVRNAAKIHPWENKIGKGFFRGSRTSEERDTLILLSREHPEILEAQYTKNQAWKSPKDTLGAEPALEVSFEEHCKYKYLFNYRGVAASFRFRHLFLCGSLVFHVGDEWQEFFYSALKPWIHYVPIRGNPTEEDIMRPLKFLRQHDDVAKKIATAGYSFISKHLKFSDVVCYWKELLKRYGALLKFQPKVEPHFVRIR